MKPMVDTTIFNVLHAVPNGNTINIPLVSAASQKWYCMMNVSNEHLPMKPKALELTLRKAGVQFLRTMKDMTGIHEMYGCQAL